MTSTSTNGICGHHDHHDHRSHNNHSYVATDLAHHHAHHDISTTTCTASNGDTLAHSRFDEYDDNTSSEHDEAHRASIIANAIRQRISLHKNMHIMDFGAGTGHLTQELAPHVGRITGVDVSRCRLKIFQSKKSVFACDTTSVLVAVQDNGDLVQQRDDDDVNDKSVLLEDEKFDGVISSTTLHQVQDLPALFAKLAGWVVANGFLVVADFDRQENDNPITTTDTFTNRNNTGTATLFHDPQQHYQDGGVFHPPPHACLDRMGLARLAGQNGFQDIVFQTVDVVRKPQGGVPIFLMTAVRMG